MTISRNFGWLSDKIVYYFSDYARLCFESFGSREKYWITLNEPQVTADEGYGFATMAPGIIAGIIQSAPIRRLIEYIKRNSNRINNAIVASH